VEETTAMTTEAVIYIVVSACIVVGFLVVTTRHGR
jgi:hypothetical protein